MIDFKGLRDGEVTTKARTNDEKGFDANGMRPIIVREEVRRARCRSGHRGVRPR